MALGKNLKAAAGNAGGAATYVDDVFSTYLYTGNGGSQTITNGIDLAGEGGMVWIKDRANIRNHELADSENGWKYLSPNLTDAIDPSSFITPLSNGYTDSSGWATSRRLASWTFRKAPKFFDVVTYTGDGSVSRSINHNLGSTPGCIIVKAVSRDGSWAVGHRGLGSWTEGQPNALLLESTGSVLSSFSFWGSGVADPTDTTFNVGSSTVVNQSGQTYVAYLFAHNNNDGGFGENADQDIIKCGSYTGNGSTNGPEINLGFEPQYIITKNASGLSSWHIYDSMRGIATGGNDTELRANTSAADSFANSIDLTATGFKITTDSTEYNSNADTFIYIAIRRPHKPAETGSEVFAMGDTSGATVPNYISGFPVDLSIQKLRDSTLSFWPSWSSRLTGENELVSSSTSAEVAEVAAKFDYNNGWGNGYGSNALLHSWMFKRSPSFFDVVCYTGTGVARTVDHNLTVAPEMMIVKNRVNASWGEWMVYHSALGNTQYIRLDSNGGPFTSAGRWNNTTPTDAVFTVGDSLQVNSNGENHIAYLFASQAGISKVGSYTGNGTSQTIDCGFTSGARFFLCKASSTTGDWHVFDTTRGIVAGNDPYLELNKTNAEVTTEDAVDPVSSGVIVNEVAGSNINTNGVTYIFYAVA